jgi:hypothetical protein
MRVSPTHWDLPSRERLLYSCYDGVVQESNLMRISYKSISIHRHVMVRSDLIDRLSPFSSTLNQDGKMLDKRISRPAFVFFANLLRIKL